ncbi:hypothetical protein K402DRAFT_393059 [Aulographum hederae CBS 113979]|uniref:Pre-mRNA-splicing factor cwc26 n=1 Tax=Aulographum hederae CBS 113979 TaxID=1176131 RepID=A0A6G1H310_9PEZI|nr:hypothetical protein K402DRAFT_393059 [Aulographum hederae CBS 113979]
MSLQNYLTKKYLNPDKPIKKKSKKRKRDGTESTGLVIADDNILGWDEKDADDNDDDDGPTIVGSQSSTQHASKPGLWKTIGAPAPSSAEQTAADAILEAAANERSKLAEEDDEAPTLGDTGLKMESGAHAGLQTAEQVTAAMAKKRATERKQFEEAMRESGEGETVYRDASGRRIDIGIKRAEKRKKEEQEAKKKKEQELAAMGDVQRAEAEERRQKLQDAQYMPLTRRADDVEMNEELKQREVWNDPAARFMTKKSTTKSKTGRKLYQGSFAPNRYGIRPGWQWDGVDRGTGFEKDWFEARNNRKNIKNLQYQWGMDE